MTANDPKMCTLQNCFRYIILFVIIIYRQYHLIKLNFLKNEFIQLINSNLAYLVSKSRTFFYLEKKSVYINQSIKPYTSLLEILKKIYHLTEKI